MIVNMQKAGCVIAVLGLALYINTLDCDMVYDDEPAIKWNKDIRPTTPWSQLFFHDFWGSVLSNPLSHKSYRPLCVATFRLNYMLHGLEPMGYHLVNMLLHAVVCYLYVQLCALIFTQVWPALIAGLLFAVHPIHTEAVAGIVGRAELLSAILFLSAFHVYRKSLNSNTSGRVNWLLVGVSIALGILAMLSKEQGITALAVCLIYDLFIFNQPNSLNMAKASRYSSSLKAPESTFQWPRPATKGFFMRGVVMSAAALVAMVTRLAVSNGALSEKLFTPSVNPPLSQETPHRQLSWLHLVCVNIWLLLSPSRLSMDWRYGAVPLIESVWDWNNLCTLLCLATLAVLTALGLSQQRNNKAVLLGISLMVVPFLPASNLFFPVGFVVAERVLYLPSMGFCMLVAHGVWQMLHRLSKHRAWSLLLKVLIGYVLCAHSLKTLARNRDWHSASSLHKAGVRFNPSNPILLSNLGLEHALKEDYSQAELLYLSSMEQTPRFSGGYHNYGLLMKLLHRYEEAEEPLVQAIELGARDAPESRLAERYDLLVSVIAMNASRLNEALKLSNYVLKQHPTYSYIYSTRCSVLMKLNRTHEFIKACELAVIRNPGFTDALYNLGIAYMKLGYMSQAEMAFRNMLNLARGSTVAMFHLATVLQTTGKTKELLEARKLWKQVLAREPQNTEALMNLAYVDSNLHHYSQALDSLEAILAINPEHREALYESGQLLYRRGGYVEAVSVLTRLISLQPGYLDTMALLSKAKRQAAQESLGHEYNYTNSTN